MAKKYYWFKMPKNFFDRHDLKIIQRRLGSDASLCYNKVILESIDHEGLLRFSPDIPYDVQTLADVLGVEYAFFEKVFNLLLSLGLVEIQEDKTICVPFVLGRIGTDSESA